jgi:ABC transport system ATP-binding/permease protein
MTLAAGATRSLRIGRAPENDVVLDYEMVSWHHARLILEASGAIRLEDLGSTNGTFLNRPDNRVQRAAVTADDHLFFGTLKVRVARLLGEALALGNASQGHIRFTGHEMVLGRDPAADYPLTDPTVSWRHARLRRTPGGIEVEDLGSQNGTFVDGAPVHGRVALKTGSEIGLGHLRFRLLDDLGTLDKRSYADNVTVAAQDVMVEVGRGRGRRRLLEPVSLTVLPGELVALMGLAGAGKTTLLKALNGYTKPTSGRVLFNGEDLYERQEQFRTQIGYVPQDDILHGQLTVREALRYTARLRTDLRADEIEARVTQVLRDLGIDDIGDRLIGSPERKVISGGQRKRVSIAMELLSDPSVLFLDEPTSGLSSYDAYQVVRLLRRLADLGKTIICTIHQPSVEVFREFDELMAVARDKGDNPGLLVYFGPAWPAAVEFFQPSSRRGDNAPGSPEDVMLGLSERPAAEWASQYRKSTFHRDYVVRRAVAARASGERPTKGRASAAAGLRQLVPLIERNLLLKVRDRLQTTILLAQAPLFAGLVSMVFFGLVDRHFDDPASWAAFSGKVSSVHFLVVVAAVWFGCNNAARDVVGETTILQRERMVNLRLPAYVLSKMAVLALLCLVQCTVLLAIVYHLCALAGPFEGLWAVLAAASLAGTTLGLLISAVSLTTEAAIALLPVVLLPFILLGGGIKPVHEMPGLAQAIAALTPTRWAYEANLVQEAAHRSSSFTNAIEQQLRTCQQAAAACQPTTPPRSAADDRVASRVAVPEVERDLAAAALPPHVRRSTLSFTFQVLATQCAVALVLVLTVLRARFQR